MKRYIAFVFAKPGENRAYLLEVAEAIKRVSNNRMKYGEGAAGMAAIGFVSALDPDNIVKPFRDLWRQEQRTWIVEIDRVLMLDQALMDWFRKNSTE